VRALLSRPDAADAASAGIERLSELQERYCRAFPRLRDEVEFWQTLWLCTDRLRDQWLRVARAGSRLALGCPEDLRKLLVRRQRALYQWSRRFVEQQAPRVPSRAHFELGIGSIRPDRQGLHQRLEGLYEAVKRTGHLPTVREGVDPPPDGVNFGIIYGCGWNVSAYSVLRAAGEVEGLNAFVAFDHPGSELYGRAGPHTIRLATAAMMQSRPDEWALVTFRRPAELHFVCPHQWTGPRPETLGVPVLRSELTLEIVDDKLETTRALASYAQRTGRPVPLIPEVGLGIAEPGASPERQRVAAEEALRELERGGAREVVVKPARGEQGRDVRSFALPQERAEAAAHAGALSFESSVVMQQRVRPRGGMDYNLRVLVALCPEGQPQVVGRFARQGWGEQVEMVEEREMLRRAGMTSSEADRLLERADSVSVDAFRAVAEEAELRHPDYPYRPLGGGSYGVPYILGIDLIGEALVMEVNGNEVAGMWTDDRLHPATRGRSSLTMLLSARQAARAYRAALSEG